MLCILHRWLISRSMNVDGPLPRRVIKHIHRCPACKSFHDHCRALADHLPKEADRQRPKVSAELHTEIIGKCYGPVPKTEPPVRLEMNIRRRRWALPPAIAAGVVLLAILAIHLYHGAEPSRPESASGGRVAVVNPEPMGWLLDGLDAGTTAYIEDSLQGPLQEEINLLKQDGKAGAEFLLACLPLDIDRLAEEDSRLH